VFTRKQEEVYGNVLNAIFNLTTQLDTHSHCKVNYPDLAYLIDFTNRFCKKMNVDFFEIDLLKDGLQFNEIINTEENGSTIFKKPLWFNLKEKDSVHYVMLYNIDELSTRSLAFKQLEILLKTNSIREYSIPVNIHFIFVGACRNLPVSNIVNVELN
jgi:hypothetical protein